MDHIAKITAQLPEHGLDAMLVTSAPGERYAVGFEGEGWVLVSRDGAHYSTDGRYIEAARQQVTGAEIVLTERGQSHLALAREEIRRRGLKRVGFESGRVSADELGRWKDSLPCELVAAQGLLDGLRAAKDEEELARMRQAQRITDEAFREILNFIRPGLTEQEVAARLVYELLRRGGRRVSFDPIVAAGANGSMPHAVPGETVIQPGMFVTMDFGCVYEGYCSDMTRTLLVNGEGVSAESHPLFDVYQIVLQAQLAAISAIRPGVRCQQVDDAARRVITEAGFGDYFGHNTGHAIGIEVHEDPRFSPRDTTTLQPGMLLTVEPGIYLPGQGGVRIEDVVLVTPQGAEVLYAMPKTVLLTGEA